MVRRVVCAALLALVSHVGVGQAATPRIVNGQSDTVVPWQVALVAAVSDGSLSLPLRVFCGGTIRDATHVITAAHCLPDSNAADVVVVASLYRRSAPGLIEPGVLAQAQGREVRAITSHPGFGIGEGADLAILTLAEPLVFNESTQPLPVVAPAGSDVGSWALISGWGDELSESQSPQPDDLRHALIQVYEPARCAAYQSAFVAATMLCAGYSADGVTRDTCQGDSGGPLARYDGDGSTTNDFDALIGVVSFGNGCANAQFPGVYTRLADADLHARTTEPTPPERLEPSAAPAITGSPVVGESLSCSAGAWTLPPTSTSVMWLSAVVDAEGHPTDVRPEGTGPTLALTTSVHGRAITCKVRAVNAGGARTAQARVVGPVAAAPPSPPVPATPPPPPPGAGQGMPVPADLVAPTTSITRRRCRHRRCALTIIASDSGGPAQRVTVKYTRISGCPRRSRRCRAVRRIAARRVARGVFDVVTPRLARGRYRFTATAVDQAGNASSKAVVLIVR